MAPVLQCPDCGEKHPLAQVPGGGAFACRGCGRVLKVPEAVSQRLTASAAPPSPPSQAASGPLPAPAATAAAAAARPDASASAVRPVPIATAVANPAAPFDPNSTRAVPAADDLGSGGRGARGSRQPVARLAPVPWWMRLLLWFVAVPLAFLIVFLLARALRVFTTNQLSDVFLANTTSRFWPVLRLLPFVALLTAAFVQAGVYGFARFLGRSRSPRAPKDLSGSMSRPPAT